MAYIFMDESGDLGFDWEKKKTSQYFVVTFLFAKNNTPIEKIIKKIFSGFTKAEIKRHNGSLHCFKEQPKTRIKLYKNLVDKDVSIMAICLNKKKVYTKLQNEKTILYNYITNILLDRIITKKLIPTDEKILFIASRRETNKFLNENFKSYIGEKIKNNHQLDISISIKTPHEEKCLQVVDFISWGIFQKYEYNELYYYDIFKTKIIEENLLYH